MTGAKATRLGVATADESRAFTWLWRCFAGSSLGDGIYQVALPVAALRIGGGPTAVALVLGAARAPWLLLPLHAGVLVDRVDRRRLLVLVTVARVVILLALALLLAAGVQAVPLLVLIAFAMGASETVFDTALHSTTPRVTPKDSLETANSRLQATETVAAQFVGPSLGGLLAGLALSLAFGVSAALSLAALLSLVRLRIPQAQQPAARGSVLESVREGFQVLTRDRTLLSYALGGGAVNCAFAAFYVAFPVLALDRGPLGLTPTQYGFLMAAPGVGGVAAGILAAPLLRRLGTRHTLLLASSALAVGFAVPGITTRLLPITVGLVMSGLLVFTNVATVSYRQRAVPDQMLGRVTAAYRLLAFGGLPLGSALAGVLMAVSSSRTTFLGAGLLVLGAGVGMAVNTAPEPRAEDLVAVPVPAPASTPEDAHAPRIG